MKYEIRFLSIMILLLLTYWLEMAIYWAMVTPSTSRMGNCPWGGDGSRLGGRWRKEEDIRDSDTYHQHAALGNLEATPPTLAGSTWRSMTTTFSPMLSFSYQESQWSNLRRAPFLLWRGCPRRNASLETFPSQLSRYRSSASVIHPQWAH